MRPPDGGFVRLLWVTSLAPPNGLKVLLFDVFVNEVQWAHDPGTRVMKGGESAVNVGSFRISPQMPNLEWKPP
jgi:hypothetical protein